MGIPRLAEYRLPATDELPTPRLTWPFEPQRAALLIHDMQDYFLNFYEFGFGTLVDNVAQLRQLGIPTFYSAQRPRQSMQERGLLTDRWGPGLQDHSDIVEKLRPTENDVVLTKHRYSAFFRSDLEQRLVDLGTDQLIICGVYAHIGITATALDAYARDIKPFVIADAIADFTSQQHAAAMEQLANTCAVVTCTGSLMDRQVGITLEQVRRDVLAVIDEPVSDSDNLVDAGLDSIRIMGLIEDWKAAGNDVTFADLAEEPTILGFHARMSGN